MKLLIRILLLIPLVAVLTGSCEKAVDPNGLLYRRWQWIESRSATGSVFRPNLTQLNISIFKSSGEYVYEFNGKQFTCCQPNRFARQGNRLIFSNVVGGYSSPECMCMLCNPYQPEQIIDSLSAQRLVLSVKGNQSQNVY